MTCLLREVIVVLEFLPGEIATVAVAPWTVCLALTSITLASTVFGPELRIIPTFTLKVDPGRITLGTTMMYSLQKKE